MSELSSEKKGELEETIQSLQRAGDKESSSGDKESSSGDKEGSSGDKESSNGDKQPSNGNKESSNGDKKSSEGSMTDQGENVRGDNYKPGFIPSVDEVDVKEGGSSSSSTPKISPLSVDHPSHKEDGDEIAKKAQTLRDLTKVNLMVHKFSFSLNGGFRLVRKLFGLVSGSKIFSVVEWFLLISLYLIDV